MSFKAKVFFDASVLFSAIFSQTGGSHKLIGLVRAGQIIGFTSQTVIEELIDNIGKFGVKKKPDLEKFIAESKLIVRERIAQNEIKPFVETIEEKDAHVIAGTISTHSQYLVTLDKKHLDNQETKSKFKTFTILSPKKLLRRLKF